MPVAYNLSRYLAPDLPRSMPKKKDGLLISPGSGSTGQTAAGLRKVLFLLGAGLLLSGFILIMALISLILF